MTACGTEIVALKEDVNLMNGLHHPWRLGLGQNAWRPVGTCGNLRRPVAACGTEIVALKEDVNLMNGLHHPWRLGLPGRMVDGEG